MNVPVNMYSATNRSLLKVKPLFCLSRAGATRLVEVGRLEVPTLTDVYKTGQLFLNKLFGYRGVILFQWQARVFDRDRDKNSVEMDLSGKEDEYKTHVFYNALVDSRDVPYIRTQTDAVTFLGKKNNNTSLYSIPGLDYVAHQHVLPYTTTEPEPLRHELLEKFLVYRPKQYPPFVAHDTLLTWQRKNRRWLELSDVHKETTENVRVTVIPFYMGCHALLTYWWRYCVLLENLGELSVQLRERHWRIFSLSGVLETVRGRGVIGEEPVLSRSQPTFQYSSHVSLHAPSGHMWGTFRLEREDGYIFDCRVPPFSLESKRNGNTTSTNSEPKN